MERSLRRLKYEVENPVGMRVYAYRNLHKNCISLMDSRGRVLKHVDAVLLSDCEFRVRKAGYEKVQRTGQRNVHAFVIGTVEAIKNFQVYVGQEVRYNPKSEKPFFQNFYGHQVFVTPKAVVTIREGHSKVYSDVIAKIWEETNSENPSLSETTTDA